MSYGFIAVHGPENASSTVSNMVPPLSCIDVARNKYGVRSVIMCMSDYYLLEMVADACQQGSTL